MGKPESKTKPGLQQEDCSAAEADGSPKHKQLNFTAWNFHRGPKTLRLLRLIFSIALAWERADPEEDAQEHARAHRLCKRTHNRSAAACVTDLGTQVGQDLGIPSLSCRKTMINQHGVGHRKLQLDFFVTA